MQKFIKDILAELLYFLSGVVGIICVLMVCVLFFGYVISFVWLIDILLYSNKGNLMIFSYLNKLLKYFTT